MFVCWYIYSELHSMCQWRYTFIYMFTRKWFPNILKPKHVSGFINHYLWNCQREMEKKQKALFRDNLFYFQNFKRSGNLEKDFGINLNKSEFWTVVGTFEVM